MNFDNRSDEFDADLLRSLRNGEDLAPETPEEVEALLKKMKERGTPIGTTQEEAERFAADIVSGGSPKLILFPQSTDPSEMEVELARAARRGKNAIPKAVEEKMQRDRAAAEEHTSDQNEEGKTEDSQ